MSEPGIKEVNSELDSGTMLQGLKAHHNMFWESVRDFHLEPLLKRVYSAPGKRKLILRWLKRDLRKRVLIRQMDFFSDPFLIEFRRDGWTAKVLDEGEMDGAEIELQCTHLGLISLSDSLVSFIFGLVRGEFKLPLVFKNLRDHYYAMRIFLGG